MLSAAVAGFGVPRTGRRLTSHEDAEDAALAAAGEFSTASIELD